MKIRVLLPSVCTLLLLSGCDRKQAFLYSAGPAADKLASVSWFALILFLVVSVIMWVLVAWAASRKRGSFDSHEPVDIGGGQAWIAIGGFGIPLIILTVVFVVGLTGMSAFPMHDQAAESPSTPDIRIVGHQWWWEVKYVGGPVDQQFTTANEIHIPVGRPVNLELQSGDVIHSFWVPKLQGKMDLVPGYTNHLRIQADHAGTYRGQCTQYCGAQHAHMAIIVVAQEPDEYEAWRQNQLKPASPPTTAEEAHGQEVFLSAPCSNCHMVRGTLAGGTVAPDLTHIASRQGIAANTYKNDQANLEAWVTHAQSMKPEVAMPNITQFSGVELRALVAYLRQLK
ncbi:MAG: cytochrome c oxidase subunit II [Acidobacteriaceae bacterium]